MSRVKPVRGSKRRRISIVGASIAVALLVGILAIALTGTDSSDDTQNNAADIPGPPSESWTDETYSGGARLVADRTDVTYGPVDYGQQVEAVYRLRNIGDETITIDEPDIKTLEGC